MRTAIPTVKKCFFQLILLTNKFDLCFCCWAFYMDHIPSCTALFHLKFQEYFRVVIIRKQKCLYISQFSYFFWCSSFTFPSGIVFPSAWRKSWNMSGSVSSLIDGFSFSLIMGSIALLLCTPGNFWLGAKHCESYLVGYWRFLYSYKYSWTLSGILLFGNSFILLGLAFVICWTDPEVFSLGLFYPTIEAGPF